ncbi:MULTISPECIES: hypothetical protein [unclassified Sphingomonas]|uniref:hypothetical protein n=1 Tax=unclassified Sphingomonas TaxID=196159 RepID=UPI00215128B4|nr:MULTISPECIES: hypothetical protein [unclassified Sphingomonas]MCR5871118.1 hypothetical protein [Sphingomonas sp. J344]UUY00567.1 hypothetical protein LRS08_05635 [Sphingomonas sp. J315]
MPIGNTLHLIDEQADAGDLIAVAPTPLFKDDDLESFARRHYESEILMMLAFDHLMAAPERPVIDENLVRPARMRMPAEKQSTLRSAFEAYKERFVR